MGTVSDEFKRLFDSYDFVNRALTEHGHALAPVDVARLERDRDDLFLQLVRFTANDPRVTLAQVRLLLSSLAALATHANQAELLRAACLTAVERLADMPRRREALQQRSLHPAGPMQDHYPPQPVRNFLDSLSDRVGVADRNYRYVFANQANARFYGLSQSDMQDVSIATVVGARVFRTFTKPNLDLCFTGQPSTHFVRFLCPHKPRLSSTQLDPIRDSDGTVRWVIATIRDVTGAPIPGELVTDIHV